MSEIRMRGRDSKDNPQTKLPISAIVVGLNESKHLSTCLPSIAFCDEIIYVDLGSEDNSVEMAKQFGASVRPHPLVPSGEHAVANVYREAKNSWILFVDPDERLDSTLQIDLKIAFEIHKFDPTVGVFSAPWQFYFKEFVLYGTPWGGRRPRMFLAHKERFLFLPETHRGRILRPEFRGVVLESEGCIHHFWSDSWISLIRKHVRYLKTEGGSRYRRGDRVSLGGVIVAFPGILANTFRKTDRRDGLRGFGLNLLWVFYKCQALLNLWLFQQLLRKVPESRVSNQ